MTLTENPAPDSGHGGRARPEPAPDSAPVPGSLPARWAHGTPGRRRAAEPPIQVHHYDEHTVILRQSKSLSYEAPFLYLLFGDDRALLLDTGATADPALFPLRATVDRLIAGWLSEHPRAHYELVVAHSHGHQDHLAADPQFAGRPATTVLPRDAESVRSFFGFGADWPTGTVSFDLGGRVLEVLGSPGHHEAAITVHDPRTGILLTGDTVLPGRLYAFDSAAYLATLDRLAAFAAERRVTHVLGGHVEMTRRPRRDHPLGATCQPDEAPLEMTADDVVAIRDAAASVAGRPGVHRFDNFVIYLEPRRTDLLALVARGLAHRVCSALVRPLRRRNGEIRP
ncbi:MBL fold metallo-hydrolase [Streptomyces sp. CA-111067]|uniref:MBL fold metallo-hydrolase n=1 Tax=Streptomyces sp. CA-111067 TaxID=3240046 RepID=UPI003D96888C